MTHATNWYIRRLEKGAAKREKKIEKLRGKIETAHEKHDAGKITRAKFEKKKQDYEKQIRILAARVSTFKGAIGKERRRIEKEGE